MISLQILDGRTTHVSFKVVETHHMRLQLYKTDLHVGDST
jgi:hypothetical protein